MAESVLEKLAMRRHGGIDPTVDADSEADASGADDGACFGCIRGNPRERAVMLQLRKADGTIKAVPYSWLEEATFHPSDGITLRVSGKTIRITGRNLNRANMGRFGLFECITLYRALWVAEAPTSMADRAGESPWVDRIEW